MGSGFCGLFFFSQDWNMISRIYPQWRERQDYLEGTIVIYLMENRHLVAKSQKCRFLNSPMCDVFFLSAEKCLSALRMGLTILGLVCA